MTESSQPEPINEHNRSDNKPVVLDFQVDKIVIDEDKRIDLVNGSSAPIGVTYFIMPVRLNVAGVELFEQPVSDYYRTVLINEPGGHILRPIEQKIALSPSPWLELPILHVAKYGLSAVREALQKGRATYHLPESGDRLHFERSGNDMVIHSEVNGRVSRVAHKDLLHGFEEFAFHVREVLNHEIPQLKNHSEWGGWFTQTR